MHILWSALAVTSGLAVVVLYLEPWIRWRLAMRGMRHE